MSEPCGGTLETAEVARRSHLRFGNLRLVDAPLLKCGRASGEGYACASDPKGPDRSSGEVAGR